MVRLSRCERIRQRTRIQPGWHETLWLVRGQSPVLLRLIWLPGKFARFAEEVKPNDLAVTRDDLILITETGTSQVTLINPQTGEKKPVDVGISKPNGIALSNDGGTLAVSDYGGLYTYLFRVNAGGILDARMPTMPMRLPINPDGEFRFNEPPPYADTSRGDGMAVDRKGRYYVTSELGVQIFDPTGRPCGVLPKIDAQQPLTTCTLGGSEMTDLFIAHGNRIYRRRLTVE